MDLDVLEGTYIDLNGATKLTAAESNRAPKLTAFIQLS